MQKNIHPEFEPAKVIDREEDLLDSSEEED